MPADQPDGYELRLPSGAVLRLQVLAPHTFRVRLRPDDRFREPPLVRYGVES